MLIDAMTRRATGHAETFQETRMMYKGSCHCGKVAFEVEGAIDSALSCNCSICRRKGSLLFFVPRDSLRLLTPDENVATYTFNQHVIRHRFCRTCGIHPYGEGTDPSGKPVAAVNIRCLDDVDPAAVPIQYFDGRSL
jgi:hypothetical protein